MICFFKPESSFRRYPLTGLNAVFSGSSTRKPSLKPLSCVKRKITSLGHFHWRSISPLFPFQNIPAARGNRRCGTRDGFIFHCSAAVKLFPCSLLRGRRRKKKKNLRWADELDRARTEDRGDPGAVTADEALSRCSISPGARIQHMADNVHTHNYTVRPATA